MIKAEVSEDASTCRSRVAGVRRSDARVKAPVRCHATAHAAVHPPLRLPSTGRHVTIALASSSPLRTGNLPRRSQQTIHPECPAASMRRSEGHHVPACERSSDFLGLTSDDHPSTFQTRRYITTELESYSRESLEDRPRSSDRTRSIWSQSRNRRRESVYELRPNHHDSLAEPGPRATGLSYG
jgi:hypothetical protein